MSDYPLTWVTENIVVGRAPMSYNDLDYLRNQGIKAIVNLCGEFSDLHELEEQAGFEVFWLPTADETAPSLDAMEKGLEWLDEAVYLGKKVFIHCRHGIGRTGTFVTAYLLRRGFSLKKAGKLLKPTSANPSNFSQWWLLRKFGKQEGQLKIGEPTPHNRNSKDLSEFYHEYEELQKRVDTLLDSISTTGSTSSCCNQKGTNSCSDFQSLELIEALYLNNRVNISLTATQRQAVIAKAAGGATASPVENEDGGTPSPVISGQEDPSACPLYQGDRCLLHDFRPIHCRLKNHHIEQSSKDAIKQELTNLSQRVFTRLFEQDSQDPLPLVSYEDTISGKFIQSYFRFLLVQKSKNGHDKT